MQKLIKLFSPVMIPSWQFFKEIAPSPQVEYALLTHENDESSNWQKLDLRPKSLSVIDFLIRLFYNPRWNEALYIMTCAEQLIINPSEYGVDEIFSRIRLYLKRREVDLESNSHIKFRLVFVSRQEDDLRGDVLFVSPVREICDEVLP